MTDHARSHPGFGSGQPRYPGTFLLAFREAAAALNWTVTRWLGGAVECRDSEGREHVVGLENLYRRARREDRSTWPELIEGFLGMIDLDQFRDPPTDLTKMAERVLVRLGQPIGTSADRAEVWSRPVANTSLVLNLVVDCPQSMYYVTTEMLDESGKPVEEWVEVALANLKAQTPAECFQVLHDESGLRQCLVADAYDSSRALLLDALLPETTGEGYFVALPGRDELLVLPVTVPALGFVPLLKGIAEKSYRTAPYAITDEVFWVREGTWYPFPIELGSDKVTAQPPPEFLEVLERLTVEEDEGTEEAPDKEET
ncbi:MAG: hypothetical protein L0Z62_28665 [Gemmataceae bacterium]|nr:hypothetical protein [Gemmataceae bacterium]